ncbi:MAG: hypothetical protein KDA32_02935 [Phycisphaerales bacterium]|nr:hypothetical protein [Phycisphaerales bacterium]
MRLMLNANAMKKSVHRNWVINDIAAGPRWMEQIDSLLRLAVASAKPTRLGDAIDVLSHPRVDLSAYAHELIRCDELLRRADSDELHILVRAAGRREDTAHLLNWAMESESDAVRGSAAEALYDCVTTKSGRLWARDALVRLSKEDVSPYVREVAAELVDQLLEALDGSDDRGGV